MSSSPICSAEVETRAHVLTPLHPEGERKDGAANAAAPPGASENPQWREAYQKGAEDARRQAEQETFHAAEALAKAAEQLRSRERSFIEQIQRDILRLSLAIARQVVMAEMKTNTDALGEMIARLLDEAEDRKVVAVRLHPEDAERFNRSPAAQALGKAGITVQSSPEVGPGGVILETGFGKLDARLETRLDEIAAALLGPFDVAQPRPEEARSGERLGLPAEPARREPRGRTAEAANAPRSDSSLPADSSPPAGAAELRRAGVEELRRARPRSGTQHDESGESLWENQPAYPDAPAESVERRGAETPASSLREKQEARP